MGKIYKQANLSETETTVNVLYGEKILSIYTNKVEHKKGKSITGSRWEIPLKEKSKISKLVLKANIFEL